MSRFRISGRNGLAGVPAKRIGSAKFALATTPAFPMPIMRWLGKGGKKY
jgi:hypothetical protein